MLTLITSAIELINKVLELEWHKIGDFGEYLFSRRGRNDPYEVLENEIELEIFDTKGYKAQHRKRRKIRFLHNHVFSYLDTAFGDGEIFEDYDCSLGRAVDCYEEGNGYRVLISMRKMKNRGDVVEFYINRTVKNGYEGAENNLQTDILYRTHQLQVRVIFPAKRFPKEVWLMEKNTRYTQVFGETGCLILADGRYQLSWQKKNPRLHESYIIFWRW